VCIVVFGKGIRSKGTSDEPPEPPQFTDLSERLGLHQQSSQTCRVSLSTFHTISVVTFQNVSRYLNI